MKTIIQRNRKESQATEFLDDLESLSGFASREFDSTMEWETTPSFFPSVCITHLEAWDRGDDEAQWCKNPALKHTLAFPCPKFRATTSNSIFQFLPSELACLMLPEERKSVILVVNLKFKWLSSEMSNSDKTLWFRTWSEPLTTTKSLSSFEVNTQNISAIPQSCLWKHSTIVETGKIPKTSMRIR